MALTLLEIVKEHAARQGLPIPGTVIGSGNDYCAQAVGLLNEFCDDLDTRKQWQTNVLEATWTSTATESQGALSTLAPYGYQGIVGDTVWDRTSRHCLLGSLSAEEWQLQKASNVSGPIPSFRLRGGNFLTIPALEAGHTIAFEYYSSYFVRESASVTKQYWTKDADTCVIDDALPVAYLRWAWKKEKGLEYAEDFAKYERMLATKGARNTTARTVDMAEGRAQRRFPGVIVPEGNWSP
jgi:hypothetical protein